MHGSWCRRGDRLDGLVWCCVRWAAEMDAYGGSMPHPRAVYGGSNMASCKFGDSCRHMHLHLQAARVAVTNFEAFYEGFLPPGYSTQADT